ncbi:UbiA family prenyltransferase [Streptomyces sp. NBC_00576]|uniref:UbiA family prenyltransferase n=1 Tax=Streptomyces sp. NBC_00576 TaxID=2903665 RepID=UPI002E8224E2|nr:UbiA family prenyltransferase [Streptomyces sp. NBC_00576]WUB73349.1 UbiA family prenyltransferase [Streptomyces sp. NBC_00576]
MRKDSGLRRYSRLTRVHAASAAAFVYPLGPLVAAGGDVSPAPVIAVSALGVLGHTYGCTVNDLADLESDRRNPARRRSVLVSGAVSITEARIALGVQLALAVALTIFAAVAGESGWLFAVGMTVLFATVTFSNTYQKRRIAHPLVMDLLFGVNMGAPAVLCCAVTAPRDLTPAWLVAVAFGIHMVLLNVVAGNLKDLEHDRAVGDDTTALRAGVRLTDSDRLIPTRSYLLLLCVLLLGSASSLLALVLAAPSPAGHRAVTTVVLLVLQGMAGHSLWTLVRQARAVDPNGRERYLGLNFFSLMVACLLWAPLATVVVAVLTAVWLVLTRGLVALPTREQEKIA